MTVRMSFSGEGLPRTQDVQNLIVPRVGKVYEFARRGDLRCARRTPSLSKLVSIELHAHINPRTWRATIGLTLGA